MQSVNLLHHTFSAMNTRMDVILWGNSPERQAELYARIQQHVGHLEQVLSRFDNSAEVYQLNKSAYNNDVEISLLLWQLLIQCMQYHDFTKGYFDITYLNGVLGPMRAGNTASIHELISLSAKNKTVRFNSPYLQLDFGGIGKGVALDAISVLLNEYKQDNALISFGESSILTRGKHPYGNYWPFSFQNELGKENVFQLTNDTVSVSGLHSVAEGKEAHIFNPYTKLLSGSKATIAVQTDSATDAEVITTALCAAPQKLHKVILQNFDVKNLINSHVLVEA